MTSAAPLAIDGELAAKDAVILPRASVCSNYPANVPGSYVQKRSELSARTTYISWCRKSSTSWIHFPAPGGIIATQASYGQAFVSALQYLDSEINAGHGDNTLPAGGHYLLGCDDVYTRCITTTPSVGLTYARAKTAVQILQNYVYMTKKYATIDATVKEGQLSLGTLSIG